MVSDNAGFAEIGQVEVLKTEPRDQQLAVTLGFKNDGDATVRLINLTQTGALLVIDNDGYSNAPGRPRQPRRRHRPGQGRHPPDLRLRRRRGRDQGGAPVGQGPAGEVNSSLRQSSPALAGLLPGHERK